MKGPESRKQRAGNRKHVEGFRERESFSAEAQEAVRRVTIMRHTPEEWAEMTEEARIFYGGQEYLPRWAEWLLVIYAMACMGLGWLFRQQDRVLKKG